MGYSVLACRVYKKRVPVTDLGLGKGSEDGHQLLIFHVVSCTERDIEDVDWLLTDVLATKPHCEPWPAASVLSPAPPGAISSSFMPTLVSSSS